MTARKKRRLARPVAKYRKSRGDWVIRVNKKVMHYANTWEEVEAFMTGWYSIAFKG